jgi:hypothetical protein
MKITPLSQALFVASGAWLIISGISELTTTSKGNEYGSWADETSLLALSMRSNGSLKVGLGIGFLAFSSMGMSANASERDDLANSISASVGDGQTLASDGTKEGDFEACRKIYVQKGGKKKPILTNSTSNGTLFTLKDIYGKSLATFEKSNTGNWILRDSRVS